jgi:D-sedoheptulose 7-phosphate isomerase
MTDAHVRRLVEALERCEPQWELAKQWGRHLAGVLGGGGRLLVAGNGGSAAQAQHLTAELVGRYRAERRPLSAIALHAETSSTTAIGNDYGIAEVFARQVYAHGRQGDVCLLMSTSGRSPNIVRAAMAARECGLDVWAMTGPGPTAVGDLADSTLSIDGADCATTQELHLVALHIVCEALDAVFADRTADLVPAGTPA